MLRTYQKQAFEMVVAALDAGERPILRLDTGSGKTVIAHALASHFGGALVLAHTAQIIQQVAARFEPCGVLMGAATRDTHLPMVAASVQTVARRGAVARPLLIVDECHRACAATYRAAIAAATRVVGLTATPCRLDGRGLGSAGFTTILEPVQFTDLAEQGWLMIPEVWAGPNSPHMDGVGVVAGDFDLGAAGAEMTKLDGDVAAHWHAHARGRRAVAFACTVAHAAALCARLRARGARAETLTGDDGPERRGAVLGALRAGQLDVLVSVNLLSEGFDEPALDCAILARPTRSLTVHRQQIGRITRPAPGKRTPLVLDHAGNTHRLGFVDEVIEWSLDGRTTRKRKEQIAKTCAACLAIYSALHKACPQCGCEQARDSLGRIIVEDTATTLGKVLRSRDTLPDPQTVANEVAPGNVDVLAYAYIVRKGVEKGYKSGWARHAYKAKRGDWPGAWAGFVEKRMRYAQTERPVR